VTIVVNVTVVTIVVFVADSIERLGGTYGTRKEMGLFHEMD
jgi:hypothetical protein